MNKKNKQSVLIVTPFFSPNQGGAESHIQKLISYINSKGNNVIVSTYQPLTTPTKGKKYEKKLGLEVFRLNWFFNGLFPKIENNSLLTFVYLTPGLLINSLLIMIRRKVKISVIHAHGFAALFVSVPLKYIFKKRLVVSTHAIYDFKSKPVLSIFIKYLLDRCDYIHAVGEPSRQEIISLGIDPQKIAVDPSWVDTKFFSPIHSKKTNRKLTVMFCGRSLEKKGIFVFAEVAKQNPQIIFIERVADGPDLERLISSYQNIPNLSIRTSLPKNFDQKMKIIRNEYRQSDIFVLPSLYPEGFAQVIVEAASCGLAIIASKFGCTPTVLKGSKEVLLNPTVKNISKIIRDLDINREKLEVMKQSSRNHAQKYFSTKNADLIYKSYQLTK